MTARLIVLLVAFLGTAAYAHRAMQPEIVLPRQPLQALPSAIGRWTGQDAPKFSDEVLAILGADDLLNRDYLSPKEPGVWPCTSAITGASAKATRFTRR